MSGVPRLQGNLRRRLGGFRRSPDQQETGNPDHSLGEVAGCFLIAIGTLLLYLYSPGGSRQGDDGPW